MEKALRIVLADDEPDITEHYQEAPTRLGHEVAVAHNGRQLVELCRSFRPDLVITDAAMPELNGIDAVEQIWQERPVPVVVVSVADHAKLREASPQRCVVHFLQKPAALRFRRSNQALSRPGQEGLPA